MSSLFMTIKTLLCKLLLCGVACLLVSGCFAAHKSKGTLQTKPVDAKVQQRYYNRGLKQYSNEKYGKAKETFQRVTEYGPNTVLGIKARENLKKIERILKTLEEIESK
jgi:outer membrane protein assembly factor BamD (BamD/ComL family)